MSFILDALKKSETDRQRQSGPSLFEVKIAPPRRALPVWAVAIVVLLGINIVVISWMLLRHSAAQQPASASTAAAVAPPTARTAASSEGAVPQVASGAQATGAADAKPNGGSPAEAAQPSAAASATSASSPAARRGAMAGAETAAPAASSTAEHATTAPPAVAPPAGDNGPGGAQASDQSDFAPAVQPASGAAISGETGDLPIYQQIVSSAGLPALHLDLHVFADRPQDRFVMINMHRLGEGDSLPNGVQVESIRPDGVVLSYHGKRFLLPRN